MGGMGRRSRALLWISILASLRTRGECHASPPAPPRAPPAVVNWQDRQFEGDLKRLADMVASGRLSAPAARLRHGGSGALARRGGSSWIRHFPRPRTRSAPTRVKGPPQREVVAP
ncbi:hypothetical protein T484DRAFT_2804349 [Baffinella frigidus]|nr:hypothetical protein T484DRAFT_2804349 [Cryptophyta sp. CCMP2293]